MTGPASLSAKKLTPVAPAKLRRLFWMVGRAALETFWFALAVVGLPLSFLAPATALLAVEHMKQSGVAWTPPDALVYGASFVVFLGYGFLLYRLELKFGMARTARTAHPKNS